MMGSKLSQTVVAIVLCKILNLKIWKRELGYDRNKEENRLDQCWSIGQAYRLGFWQCLEKFENMKIWGSENLRSLEIWEFEKCEHLRQQKRRSSAKPKTVTLNGRFGFPRGRNLVKAEVELRLKPNRSWSWVSSFLQSVLKNMKKGMSFQTAGRTFHCPQPCVCRSRVEVEVWWMSMPIRSRPGNRFD